MADYYFKFTIRPVQEFIGQARKFVDLKNGSRLLSSIMSHVMKNTLKKFPNTEFIYPYYDENEQANANIVTASFPNVFIARISVEKNSGQEKTIETLGSDLRNEIADFLINQFNSIGSQTKKQISSNKEVLSLVREQLKNLLLVDWVLLPQRQNQSEAKFNFQLNQLFSATKNTYSLDEISYYQAPGIKCNICGQRNAVIFFDKTPPKESPFVTLQIYSPREGKSGEGLCGVCYTKRLWGKEQQSNKPFTSSSLANLANMHLVPQFESSKAFKELITFYENLQPSRETLGRFDMELFFPENHSTPEAFEKTIGRKIGISQDQIDEYKVRVKKVLDELKEVSKKTSDYCLPLKYYALMLFDGDNMGRLVSGKQLDEEEPDEAYKKRELFNNQRQISQQLHEFTNEIHKIVRGTDFSPHDLIYAGGDDVFVALNLKTALETVRRIRETYPKILGKSSVPNATASAGIVIAHYKMPLSYVLATLRSAEKQAKTKYGSAKNAVTIVILTHTGQKIQETFKWQYETGSSSLVTIKELENFIQYLRTDFSPSFIYSLQREFSFLLETHDQEPLHNSDETRQAITLEFKRLLRRSRLLKHKENGELHEKIKNAEKIVSILLTYESFQTLINFLLIADFLSRRVFSVRENKSI